MSAMKDAFRFELNHHARALVNAAIALERRSNDDGASTEALASLWSEAERAMSRIDRYITQAGDEEDAAVLAVRSRKP